MSIILINYVSFSTFAYNIFTAIVHQGYGRLKVICGHVLFLCRPSIPAWSN